jgi:hypothetical protein
VLLEFAPVLCPTVMVAPAIPPITTYSSDNVREKREKRVESIKYVKEENETYYIITEGKSKRVEEYVEEYVKNVKIMYT